MFLAVLLSPLCSPHLPLELLQHGLTSHPVNVLGRGKVGVGDPQRRAHQKGDPGLVELKQLLENYPQIAQSEDHDHAEIGVLVQPLRLGQEQPAAGKQGDGGDGPVSGGE